MIEIDKDQNVKRVKSQTYIYINQLNVYHFINMTLLLNQAYSRSAIRKELQLND
jgi:hypothetical protein